MEPRHEKLHADSAPSTSEKSESVMVIGASTLAKPVIKEEGSIKDVSVSA